MDKFSVPIIAFESPKQFVSYITNLPSFYEALTKSKVPSGLFMVNAPSSYPSQYTSVYNLSRKEIESCDVSKLKQYIMDFKKEEESLFFQDIHIISTDIENFLSKKDSLVANYLHDLFKHPELVYHVQHLSIKFLVAIHFSPKDKLKYKSELSNHVKKLNELEKENCDVRIASLVRYYEQSIFS